MGICKQTSTTHQLIWSPCARLCWKSGILTPFLINVLQSYVGCQWKDSVASPRARRLAHSGTFNNSVRFGSFEVRCDLTDLDHAYNSPLFNRWPPSCCTAGRQGHRSKLLRSLRTANELQHATRWRPSVVGHCKRGLSQLDHTDSESNWNKRPLGQSLALGLATVPQDVYFS